MSRYHIDYEKADENENDKSKKTISEIGLTILQIILSVIMAIIHA